MAWPLLLLLSSTRNRHRNRAAGVVTKCDELKCLTRPGTGARARGPAAVGLTELGGVAGSSRGRKWRQRVRAAERFHLETGVGQ